MDEWMGGKIDRRPLVTGYGNDGGWFKRKDGGCVS